MPAASCDFKRLMTLGEGRFPESTKRGIHIGRFTVFRLPDSRIPQSEYRKTANLRHSENRMAIWDISLGEL
jgi:hypothetical protein